MDEKNKHYLKFTKDVLWVSLSQILVGLFGIITLPVLTKNFGPELYGLWSQIYITVALLPPILTLAFGNAIVRYLSHEENKKILSQEITAMLFTILTLTVFVIIIASLFSYQISIFLFKNSSFAIFVPLMIIWAGAYSLFSFLIAYLRSKSRIKFLSILNLANSATQLSLIFILTYLTHSMLFIVISQLLIQITFLIIIYVTIFNDLGFGRPNFGHINRYLSFSLPQIPSAILLWILNYVDRYLILFYLSLVEVGIYSVSYNLGWIISFFYSPLGFVVYPILSKNWEKSRFDEVKKYLEYSTKIFLTLALPASLGLYVLSVPILKILTTSQFVTGGEITFLIAFGYVFYGLYQINAYIILLIQQTKWIPLMILLSSIINIILNIILIPKIGINGAAFATLISYLTLAVIVSYWARKEINYSIDIKFLSKVILASILMGIVIYLLVPHLSGILQVLLSIPIGAIVYFAILMLLKAFTESEKKLIYNIYEDLKTNLFG